MTISTGTFPKLLKGEQKMYGSKKKGGKKVMVSPRKAMAMGLTKIKKSLKKKK